MIGLLERQIQIWDGRGEVWRSQIIEPIRTILKNRLEKGRRKRVERPDGYSNDEVRVWNYSGGGWIRSRWRPGRCRERTWGSQTAIGSRCESEGIR